MLEWIKKNEAIFGTICWPLFTWVEYSQAEYGAAMFGMFCAGVSAYRLLSELN